MAPEPHDAGALTDAAYWDGFWEGVRLPIQIRRSSFLLSAMVRFLERELETRPGERFLEVGCGSSPWMPLFAERFGLAVEGVDNSPRGAELCRKNLEVLEIPGRVHEEDFFDLARREEGGWDVVASFGVIEHFEAPEELLRAKRRVLGPGGRIVVGLPHLSGFSGRVFRAVNRAEYDTHLALPADRLQGLLEENGFEQVRCRYVGGIHMGFGPTRSWPAPLRLGVHGAMRAYSLLFGLIGLLSPFDLSNRWLSSYIMATARRS